MRLITAVISAFAASLWIAQIYAEKPAPPASRPAQPAAKTATPSPTTKPSPKSIETSDELVNAFRKLTEDWAEKTKQFVPKLHLAETEHFLIYSAWEKNQDKGLSDAIEKIYAAMCRQFDVDVKDRYWAGKLPVFVMETKEQFVKFTTEVDKANSVDAAGYCGYITIGFTYIVSSEIKKLDWFYELFTHESTHAFLNRYKTNVHPPRWVHEGIAEYMAATLVPNSIARTRYTDAARVVIDEKKDVSNVFKNVKSALEYGIAQSFVRYLIQRDTKAFLKFIDLIKEGKSDDDALKEAYKLTKEQFYADWKRLAAGGAIK